MNDWKSNLLIHHLESFLEVASGEYKEDFMTVMFNAVDLVKKNVEKIFGADNIQFLVSKFVQTAAGSVPMINHGRILAEQADDGGNSKKDTQNDDSSDFAHSIRLIFGVVFFFLIMYVSVYLYRMEVYKDSLIYCKFITSKKDKKAA